MGGVGSIGAKEGVATAAVVGAAAIQAGRGLLMPELAPRVQYLAPVAWVLLLVLYPWQG